MALTWFSSLTLLPFSGLSSLSHPVLSITLYCFWSLEFPGHAKSRWRKCLRSFLFLRICLEGQGNRDCALSKEGSLRALPSHSLCSHVFHLQLVRQDACRHVISGTPFLTLFCLVDPCLSFRPNKISLLGRLCDTHWQPHFWTFHTVFPCL